jgi:hypothetical protein
MSRGLNVCRNAVLRGPNKWLTRSMCECSRNSPVDWVWTLATEVLSGVRYSSHSGKFVGRLCTFLLPDWCGVVESACSFELAQERRLREP